LRWDEARTAGQGEAVVNLRKRANQRRQRVAEVQLYKARRSRRRREGKWPK